MMFQNNNHIPGQFHCHQQIGKYYEEGYSETISEYFNHHIMANPTIKVLKKKLYNKDKD